MVLFFMKFGNIWAKVSETVFGAERLYLCYSLNQFLKSLSENAILVSAYSAIREK